MFRIFDLLVVELFNGTSVPLLRETTLGRVVLRLCRFVRAHVRIWVLLGLLAEIFSFGFWFVHRSHSDLRLD